MAQERRTIRTVGDMLAAFGGIAEALRAAGIDINGATKAWSQGQQQIKQRLEDVSGFVTSGIREAYPHIPDIFQWLQNRQIPSPLRKPLKLEIGDEEIEIGKGFDESMSIIALAGQFRIPKQLPAPLDEQTEKKYINQVKQGLIDLQKQVDAGLLNETGFNSLLDFAVKDEFDDAFQSLKAFVKKHLPEARSEIDKLFTPLATWSKNLAKPKPKQKGAKAFLKRWLF